jgi:hypothetical protein
MALGDKSEPFAGSPRKELVMSQMTAVLGGARSSHVRLLVAAGVVGATLLAASVGIDMAGVADPAPPQLSRVPSIPGLPSGVPTDLPTDLPSLPSLPFPLPSLPLPSFPLPSILLPTDLPGGTR